jgi:hypothetical protein
VGLRPGSAHFAIPRFSGGICRVFKLIPSWMQKRPQYENDSKPDQACTEENDQNTVRINSD